MAPPPRALLLVCALTLGAAAVLRAQASGGPARRSVDVDGMSRPFLLDLPPGRQPGRSIPLLFVFLFISSMNAPRDLIGIEWFQTAATLNPVSYMIECVRSLIIVGWDAQALFLGFAMVIVLGLVSLPLASWALRTRMTRT